MSSTFLLSSASESPILQIYFLPYPQPLPRPRPSQSAPTPPTHAIIKSLGTTPLNGHSASSLIEIRIVAGKATALPNQPPAYRFKLLRIFAEMRLNTAQRCAAQQQSRLLSTTFHPARKNTKTRQLMRRCATPHSKPRSLPFTRQLFLDLRRVLRIRVGNSSS